MIELIFFWIFFKDNTLSSPTQSKGGLKYELVLEKPSNDTPPKINRPVETPKQLSAEDIENKLREAEERRKTIEAQKILVAKESISKISELKDKRNEIEEQKIEITRQSLEKKMEAFKENRETHIKAIQEKQKEHVRQSFTLLSSCSVIRMIDSIEIQ